jgi:photosystem II stability/assembly factor-like uncharacterized protein
VQPTSPTVAPEVEAARLVEESSLGTVGARQLRSRTAASTVAVIRARACFSGSDTGRAWWDANRHNPDALRRKARELADAGDLELSHVLTCAADGQQSTTHADEESDAGHPRWDQLRPRPWLPLCGS